MFWLRMPLPFALDHINLWVLRDGAGWTLVDCGLNSPATRELWEQVVRLGSAAGCRCGASSSRTTTPTTSAWPAG